MTAPRPTDLIAIADRLAASSAAMTKTCQNAIATLERQRANEQRAMDAVTQLNNELTAVVEHCAGKGS